MKQIIFATGNAGKMKEIREILNGTGWNVLSLKDAGIDADIEENGTTFEENAKISLSLRIKHVYSFFLAFNLFASSIKYIFWSFPLT